MKSWIIVGLFACMSMATANSSSLNVQQHRLYRHIDEGVRSGSLTNSEARVLRSRLRSVRTEERLLLRDGELERAERRALRRELGWLKRDIHRETHDWDRRRD